MLEEYRLKKLQEEQARAREARKLVLQAELRRLTGQYFVKSVNQLTIWPFLSSGFSPIFLAPTRLVDLLKRF